MKLPAWLAGDEDYRSIARAVQGPMRRWWRGIGIWWAAASLVLIGAVLLLIWLALSQRLAGNLPGQVPAWAQWLDLAHWLTVPLAALLWLLAARRAVGALAELAASAGLRVGDRRMTSFRFRLALGQTVVPLVIMVTYLTVLDLRFGLPLFHSEFWTAGDNLQLIAGTGEALFGSVMALSWLAALLAVPGVPRWLVWLWYMAIYGGWFQSLFFFTAMQLDFEYPFLTAQMDMLIVDEVGAALQVAGTGLVLLVLHLVARRRESGYRLAAFIGVLGILAAWRAGLGSQPQDVGSVAYEVDYALALLYKLPVLHGLAGVKLLEDSGLKVLVFLLEYRFELKIDPWLFWVVWPIQAAIAVGYLWLIHFLITRGAAKSAARQAV